MRYGKFSTTAALWRVFSAERGRALQSRIKSGELATFEGMGGTTS